MSALEEIFSSPEPVAELHDGADSEPLAELPVFEEIPGEAIFEETILQEALAAEEEPELAAEAETVIEAGDESACQGAASLLHKFPPSPDEFTGEEILSDEIPAVIGLLDHLRQLAEELPEKDRDFYLRGSYSAALESVIDNLKNMTTIGDTHGS